MKNLKKGLLVLVIAALLFSLAGCGPSLALEDKGKAVAVPSDIVDALLDTPSAQKATELTSEKISETDIQAFQDKLKNSQCVNIFTIHGSDTSSYVQVKGGEPTLAKNQTCVSVVLLDGSMENIGWAYFIVQNNPATQKSYISDMGIKLMADN